MFPSSSAMKIVLSKHVVLTMRVIDLITNLDDIKQERPNQSPILKLKKNLNKSH